MRAVPPEPLMALLEELALASPRQVRAVAPRVSRQPAEFDSVWIDALQQARAVTPYQAAELRSGRGRRLRVGVFLLDEKLGDPFLGESFRAHRCGSTTPVRLTVFDGPEGHSDALLVRLTDLAQRGAAVEGRFAAPILDAGRDNGRVWAVARWVEGPSAAQWMLHHGRFPAEVVGEIARMTLSALASLEAAGIYPGDISPNSLILADGGAAVLVDPGLSPDVPSRDPSAVLDSCAALWWHLLCGRSLVAGGAAVGRGRTADLRHWAPEAPAELCDMMRDILAQDSAQRPQSVAEAVQRLGSPTPDAEQCVAEGLVQQRAVPTSWPALRRTAARLGLPLTPTTAAAACLFVVALLGLVSMFWHGPGKRDGKPPSTTSIQSQQPGRAMDGPEVVAAAHVEPATESALDWKEPLDADALKLRPGMRIAPTPGGRLTIHIGRKPLQVEHDDVRFENCDFRLEPSGKATAEALLQIACARSEFRRCTFRAGESEQPSTNAICWVGPAGERSLLALSGGRLKLTDCVFQQIDAAIDCRQEGAAMIVATNVLHAGRGPLVRWNHAPRADEPRRLTVSLLTLRGGGPLMECRYDALDAPGENAIEADSCIFAPAKDEPLLRFTGTVSPVPLLAELRYSGQSSLLTTQTDFAQWQRSDGSRETLDDSGASIAGLVRGLVRFAGEDAADPAASTVVECRAPLLSADSPGINPVTLPVVKKVTATKTE